MGVPPATCAPVHPCACVLGPGEPHAVSRTGEHGLGVVEPSEELLETSVRVVPDPEHGCERPIALVAALQLAEQRGRLLDPHVVALLDQGVHEIGGSCAGGSRRRERAPAPGAAGFASRAGHRAPTPRDLLWPDARPRGGELGRSGVRRVELYPVPRRLLEVVADESRPARRAPRSPRASRRTARGAPPAPPSAAPRRPCRGSGGGGSERRRRQRSPCDPGGRAPCGRARAAARGRPPPASPGRAPSRLRGGRPGLPPHRARSRGARRRSARRAAPGAAPGSSAARRPCRRASRASAAISSRNSGLPSAVATIAPARLVVELDVGEEAVGKPSSVRLGERLEQDRRGVQLAAAPARPDVEQLGSRDAEEEDRRGTRPVDDVLDEVEHRLAPPSGGRRSRARAAARGRAPRGGHVSRAASRPARTGSPPTARS